MTITLDEAGLLSALGLRLGQSLGEAWTLDRIVGHHEGGAYLSYRASDGRGRVGLQIRPRDDARPAWRRTHHLDVITHVVDGVPEAPLLAAWGPLVDRLGELDGPSMQVVDPVGFDDAPDVRRLSLDGPWQTEAPSPFDFGRVLVLDLASDCGQACSFCSTRVKFSPRTSFGDQERDRLLTRMAEARGDGYDVLRLSGIDPLTHPHVLDVMAAARPQGFRHVHVYSPSTRYADEAFLAAVLDALPAGRFTLHIPLYGPSSRIHDAVTGVPGSFDRAMAGLRHIAEAGQMAHVVLLTVVTQANAGDMPALRALFRQMGRPVQVFMAFPASRDPDDAFFEAAVRHEDAVAPLAASDPPMGLSEILPCVRWRHQQNTGSPALTTGGFHPVTAHLGTLFDHAEYRRMDDGPEGNTFRVPVTPCPHIQACALSQLCPGCVYTAYADRFGLEELQPVSAEDVAGLDLPAVVDL